MPLPSFLSHRSHFQPHAPCPLPPALPLSTGGRRRWRARARITDTLFPRSVGRSVCPPLHCLVLLCLPLSWLHRPYTTDHYIDVVRRESTRERGREGEGREELWQQLQLGRREEGEGSSQPFPSLSLSLPPIPGRPRRLPSSASADRALYSLVAVVVVDRVRVGSLLHRQARERRRRRCCCQRQSVSQSVEGRPRCRASSSLITS